ncbi:unnamed protein product [Heterotrigona itama]|uniref:NTF2-related export protein n=1 Tax=Heterotrigona itama TaxID=395501 RepID=A0A6V7GS50_9HYME|nr:unnamed protein product [Heterotrigona itama]
MALNAQYEVIGKGFVQQYYAMFDDPAQRPNLINMYNSLTFQKINRIITAIDSQPMFDGGVLINVLGRLQTDEDQPHAYIQTFVLKPIGTSFYVQHDIFRLALHNTADEDPPHAFSQIFVLKPLGNSFFCQHDIFRLGIHDSA